VDEDSLLAERFAAVNDRIARALARSGRQGRASAGAPGGACGPGLGLVAVSKTHPAPVVAALVDCWNRADNTHGNPVFGESYVQEALQKMDDLRHLAPAPEWHFIGHIQSRKARDIAGRFSLVHSLGSEKVALALRNSLPQGASQPVLVQVNVGREEQKSGVLPEKLEETLNLLQGLPNLPVRGLMCLPPYDANPERSRPFFVALRTLAEEMRARTGLPLPLLSMGMSHDLEVAIEEGATLVRVGTDIFGVRE
jgi:pyridoxal phosphate enzyme, YggS family